MRDPDMRRRVEELEAEIEQIHRHLAQVPMDVPRAGGAQLYPVIHSLRGAQSKTIGGGTINYVEYDFSAIPTSVPTEVPPASPATAGVGKNLGTGILTSSGARVWVALIANPGSGNQFDWLTSLPDFTTFVSLKTVTLAADDTGNDVTVYMPHRF